MLSKAEQKRRKAVREMRERRDQIHDEAEAGPKRDSMFGEFPAARSLYDEHLALYQAELAAERAKGK